jgi:hypothetical protein
VPQRRAPAPSLTPVTRAGAPEENAGTDRAQAGRAARPPGACARVCIYIYGDVVAERSGAFSVDVFAQNGCARAAAGPSIATDKRAV